ncbi:MAG: nitrogenase component 1 [Methanoregula sp.]|nr:nitrogenase component 1 [Methanoregula sp.]
MIPIKIAIYGKGGIGKSTISANLSAALSENGHRILQIGCDPKHDSTRLLLGGRIPTTVLQYIKTVLPAERRPEDIVYQGYGNVACVEAGGPEPGVGCAGRGILTAFETLEDLGVRSSLFDITLYDVLGDVVCGGFAVPIRHEYADAVYIITSGEYLSLYAANNILRGIRNFTETKDRVAGLIYNARNIPEENERVTRFADAVHLPVVAHVPRSGVFARAEKDGCTLIERYPEAPEAALFRALAGHAERIRSEEPGVLYPALPLSDEDLERIVLSREDTHPKNKFVFLPDRENPVGKCISPSVKNKRPLFGCAFAGAVSVTAQISDAVTVMHCPRSCALMIYEKLLVTEEHSALRYGYPYKAGMAARLVTTDMTDEDFIFGGEKKLSDTLVSVIRGGCRTIFIVTACPPGITGDDIGKVREAVLADNPDVRIVPVRVDGNLVGDGLQGRMDAHRAVTSLIAPGTSRKTERSVNIIAEKWGAANIENDMEAVRALLERLSIAINCRFLGSTDSGSLLRFNDASLNLPTERDETLKSIKKMLAPVSDVPFFDQPLPTGFNETKNWLLAIAQVFGEEEKARQIISFEEVTYRKRIADLRPELEGKTLLISTYPRSFDWICDLAVDLGMTILKAGITYSPFVESFVSRYAGRFPVVQDYTVELRSEDIRVLQPDLLLFTYPALKTSDRVKSAPIPFCPGIGFSAGVEQAERWIRLIRHSHTEGWKADGEGLV